MSEDILNVDENIKFKEDSFDDQFLPIELLGTNKTSLSGVSEEFNFALPSFSAKSNMVVEEARYTYPTQLTNSFDRENWTVSTDHCYARPWNWRPEASFLKPTKTLFIPKLVPVKIKSTPNQDSEFIDVEAEVEVPVPNYDVDKAKILMEECEKFAFSAKTDSEEDWEEKVSKLYWTTNQNKLFNGMVSILNNFNLARLAYSNSKNEPLLRRTVVDKAVQRFRRLLASVLWDPKLVQWLHQLLADNLGPHYLAFYLDILQTLKSKLPTFVDKMMHGSAASVRNGTLNNSNLAPLLEKPWDPLSTTLMQDKPKKLPGNPVIVVVPSGPTISKMLHKWINLLSNLATVVTVPVNFGSTGHRMAIPTILDQLFSVTRGKIQDVREDYPGRNIILAGFNSGAALALQVAQVESVLCVISIGFSLLTAEGPRGEPDDNILELQCPVLFIVGQCSSTSTQEDLEDLRERMRVETGLLVVGSADEYLRVSKKKKKQEGITQSIVDRCIVDEIGEFVSGLILSPYPPQIRQSPAHVPPETPIKKVGRPPGSKTKNRLEAKWAQQIAQGNTPANPNSASPTSPPYSTTPTPDTSSNDSSHTDKTHLQNAKPDQSFIPIKKIKTLKPVISVEQKTTSSPPKNQPQQQPARTQAFAMNRNLVHGNTNISNLLQGGIKTIPPTIPKASTSGIKVLENVTINSNITSKLIPNRSIDLSKITLVNSKTPSTSISNVLLLPDGKIKTIGANMKGTGSTPIMLPISQQKNVTKPTTLSGAKYITGKRQLINQKPPRPIKKSIFIPSANIESNLPPPTNLTTQDIMDLPIIFADDNQIINTNTTANSTITVNTTTTVSTTPTSIQLITQVPKAVTPAKYMLVNKQSISQGNFIITPSIKRTIPATFNKPSKYTKIILSSKKTNLEDLKTAPKVPSLYSELTGKKVINTQGQIIKTLAPQAGTVGLVDLENEIKATAVPKPSLCISDIKQIKILPKVSGELVSVSSIKSESSQKRSPSVDIDENDPDYIPPKNLKLE
ncbi:KAT8 regulatory NSL complex subunit 3 isoform X2 [Diorhabda sublineata]|uniref:KAT8 regulatory NSL complex subunit 3 isoform X2 n=1 Tax=Diorhabda sublineata TaxID=1163346 RepID=UPI0024E0F868|nr:KAT8 regulatory NSL complex subunit 3 isoform X2 [Diorhabda sublineata]